MLKRIHRTSISQNPDSTACMPSHNLISSILSLHRTGFLFTAPHQIYQSRALSFLPSSEHRHPYSTTPPPTTMPPDAIIAALKQGNALELEFVKKLKEGLDVIADGMQTECYKRGDALDELREMLQGVDLDGVSTLKLWKRTGC
jgi:hypothetical protein